MYFIKQISYSISSPIQKITHIFRIFRRVEKPIENKQSRNFNGKPFQNSGDQTFIRKLKNHICFKNQSVKQFIDNQYKKWIYQVNDVGSIM